MMPFIVYALPRSRTAWLSALLTYREVVCHHEQAPHMRSWNDVRRFFAKPNTGTVETGVAPGWRLIHALVPHINAVVVHRSVDEVVASVDAFADKIIYDRDKLQRNMERLARELRIIAKQPHVLSVEYADLDKEETCQDIWEHCLPHPFDWWRWETLRQENIQIDVPGHLAWCFENREAIADFKRECWRVMRAWRTTGVLA